MSGSSRCRRSLAANTWQRWATYGDGRVPGRGNRRGRGWRRGKWGQSTPGFAPIVLFVREEPVELPWTPGQKCYWVKTAADIFLQGFFSYVLPSGG